MTRTSSKNSEVDRIWGERISQVKAKASTSLVTGSEHLSVLSQVDSSRLVRGCLAHSTLVGLLPVSDKNSADQEVHFTPYSERIDDTLSICLVYLLEGEAARNVLVLSIPAELSSKQSRYFETYFQNHSFVLFVEGQTDINLGKPFATKDEAIEYLQTCPTLESVLTENLYAVEDVLDFMKAHPGVEPDVLTDKTLFYPY